MDDADRSPFGCSREYTEHYSFCTYDSYHGSEFTNLSHIVEGEVHMRRVPQFSVTTY